MGKMTASSDVTFVDLQFHQNGNELWLMSKNSHITVIDTQKWHILKTVSQPERYYIKMSSSVSPALAKEAIGKTLNSLWIGVTSTKQLVFLSENSTNNGIDSKAFVVGVLPSVKRFSLSPDSKFLALLSTDGLLLLYSTQFLLRQTFQTVQSTLPVVDNGNIQLKRSLNAIDKKVIGKFNISEVWHEK